jgi:hypothetical protein
MEVFHWGSLGGLLRSLSIMIYAVVSSWGPWDVDLKVFDSPTFDDL